MKKALIIGLLIIAMLLAAPFADGLWVKHHYYKVNELISERTPFTLKVVDYRRGWLSSTATLEVTLGTPTLTKASDATEKNSPHFIIKDRLYHGPIILRSNKPFATFGKGLTFALALTEQHLNQPDLKISNLVEYHYNGNITAQLDCPLLTNSAASSDKLMGIQGLSGTFTLSKRLKHSAGDIRLVSADIPLEQSHYTIKNARYTYALDKGEFDSWYGNRQLSIADSTIKTIDKIVLNGIVLKIADKTAANHLSSTLEAKVDSLALNDKKLGRQQFNFNLSNLDLKTLSQLGQKADTLDAQGTSFTVRALELTPLALQLLSNGIHLNLSGAEFNTEWGVIRGNASLELVKQHPHADIHSLLNSIIGDADFTFPTKLLQDTLESRYQSVTTAQQNETEHSAQTLAKEDIDRWVLAGWLIPDGDRYQVHLSYIKNQFLLNGKPLNLSSLPLPDFQSTTPQRLR